MSVRTPSTKSSRLSHSSKRSGYTSSSGSSHSFGSTLHEAYAQWNAADEASQRLPREQREFDECDRELATAKKMLTNLQAGRSPPRALKTKMSLLQVLGKGKNVSVAHLPIQPIPDGSTAEIVDASVRMHDLERQHHALSEQLEATKTAAATLDQCFDLLKNTLDNGPLPWWRYSQGNEHEIYRAEKSLAAREKAYIDATSTTKALARARLAIQSSHHHYLHAIDIMENICSRNRSTFAAAIGDEQSKQSTYQEAVEWAKKAQVCLAECLRVLEPQWDLIRKDEQEDRDFLRQSGLLQAVKIYELMYGGAALKMGITQQVQAMLQKQVAVFERLTHFAVGIQECTAYCESVEQDARASRDVARRYAVSLWMNTPVPASP
ncbi:uncharacterized protein LAESUDRAFT_763181 [Laetiporus sulphureus 93-53]|uniref:Uncharacterized protein n=1 Tax=Laetiporus sulphureus 93-53 TaxID=1314785 RepID=A0A165C2B9_9APHY|nr:uncharacterized protein LAESUDRAFT_763181 [Laetiporus sulphureus 93-53]KZT02073.1 hypothetical protein LAESUDRAFT_763181 [Laetiporus sulphureus 93-53]